ncbi:hypothetical protein NUSPORA_01551 [Nucleospora cyclopteri]
MKYLFLISIYATENNEIDCEDNKILIDLLGTDNCNDFLYANNDNDESINNVFNNEISNFLSNTTYNQQLSLDRSNYLNTDKNDKLSYLKGLTNEEDIQLNEIIETIINIQNEDKIKLQQESENETNIRFEQNQTDINKKDNNQLECNFSNHKILNVEDNIQDCITIFNQCIELSAKQLSFLKQPQTDLEQFKNIAERLNSLIKLNYKNFKYLIKGKFLKNQKINYNKSSISESNSSCIKNNVLPCIAMQNNFNLTDDDHQIESTLFQESDYNKIGSSENDNNPIINDIVLTSNQFEIELATNFKSNDINYELKNGQIKFSKLKKNEDLESKNIEETKQLNNDYLDKCILEKDNTGSCKRKIGEYEKTVTPKNNKFNEDSVAKKYKFLD